MRQPTVDEMFDKLENKELNHEIKEIVEDEIISEIVIAPSNEELTNDSDEIIEVRYGNEIYKSWKVKFIRPKITKFLKGMYSDSLIIRGIIDIVVFDYTLDEIIPVEIQKTPVGSNQTFQHSTFEDLIRRQVEGNIMNYGRCWFFLDSEYLRYLQTENIGKATNINMTWFIKLMKESTLKVFAIRYDGYVKELTTKDFNFLKNISQTCEIGCDNDERVLNRNKLKIQKNLLRGYNFTQEEITKFENTFDNRSDDNKFRHSIDYFVISNNERCKLYGNVLKSVNNLIEINNVLSCSVHKNENLYYGIIVELFHQNAFHGQSRYAQIQFIDRFDIAKYFPGYLRNKEMWDYCKRKQRSFSSTVFRGIITGTFNYELIKKQSTMLDF